MNPTVDSTKATNAVVSVEERERLRRWRLVLGRDSDQSIMSGMSRSGAGGAGLQLAGSDAGMDAVLDQLYDQERSAGLGGSSPRVARWLGDIRTYFPTSAVRVMQQDALERL